MDIRAGVAMIAAILALASPAFAQPDFAGVFGRLDADKDGVLSFGEIRYEGVEAERYGRPIESFVTDDGGGVQLWHWPFGIRTVSMSAGLLEARNRLPLGTFPRDERVSLAPWLMLAGNPELRTMSPSRFEEELRRHAALVIDDLDTNMDGGVAAAEVDALMFQRDEHRRKNPDYQRGPGGDAMRAKQRELWIEFYASLDLDGDGVFTEDDMLEVILNRMVAAFAPPA